MCSNSAVDLMKYTDGSNAQPVQPVHITTRTFNYCCHDRYCLLCESLLFVTILARCKNSELGTACVLCQVAQNLTRMIVSSKVIARHYCFNSLDNITKYFQVGKTMLCALAAAILVVSLCLFRPAVPAFNFENFGQLRAVLGSHATLTLFLSGWN